MKDYYDIYFLANKFDFDGSSLVTALRKTFDNRGRAFTVEQFDQVLAFDKDEGMKMKWKAFAMKTSITEENYGLVLNAFKAFLEQPYLSAIHDDSFQYHWIANSQQWGRD